MAKTAPTAIYQMTEGEVLVRGTTDPTEAIRIIVEGNYEENWQWEEIIDGASRDGVIDPTLTEDDRAIMVAEAAAFFDRLLKPQNHSTGWFRRNVQAPGGDYTWMLGHMDGPGRGNFRGVLFD